MGVSWQGSTRHDRLPGNWPALRRKRLELDGHQCTKLLPSGARCPERATDVDHVTAMLDDHSPEALRSMCRAHHQAKSSAEGGRASAAMRRRIATARWRPQEDHPGLLPKEAS